MGRRGRVVGVVVRSWGGREVPAVVGRETSFQGHSSQVEYGAFVSVKTMVITIISVVTY